MLIRTLTEEDAVAYRQIRLRSLQDHPEAFGSAYEDQAERPLEETIERLRQMPGRQFTLGAFEGDELIGVVSCFRFPGRKRGHRAAIVGMYVSPEQRGRGVGRTLLHAAIQQVSAWEDVEEMVLAVTVGNEPARRLYTSMGFQRSHVVKRYIKINGSYYDVEWMRRPLHGPGAPAKESLP